LTCKTVFHITYTVLVETLNPAESINMTYLFAVYGDVYSWLHNVTEHN